MNRFIVEKNLIGKDEITITDAADIRHLVRVLRMQKGEELFVSDGEGGGYIGAIEQVSKDRITLKIKKTYERQKKEDQKVRITLACAIPKNTGFEDIVDKCTQLGVDEIIPILTERTLVEKAVFEKKSGRLKRIIVAAAKQSGALFLPQLRAPQLFDDLIRSVGNFDLCLIPNLSSKPLSLKDSVSDFNGRRLMVMIGPEGDFSEQEIDRAFQAGCKGVDLGSSVLRVDTAAIAVVSFLRLYFNL